MTFRLLRTHNFMPKIRFDDLSIFYPLPPLLRHLVSLHTGKKNYSLNNGRYIILFYNFKCKMKFSSKHYGIFSRF